VNTDKCQKNLFLLNNLFESLGDSSDMSTDEVKEDLRSDGVDPNKALLRLMGVVKQASADSKRAALDIAREKRLKQQGGIKNIFGKYKSLSRDQLLDKINALVGGSGLPVAASYRELEKQTDDNLRALLEDLEMLKRLGSTEPNDD
jgi:hypothetical protein